MNLEFAHLDQSWLLINYNPSKISKSSHFFALTNIGIMLPVGWNKIFSNKMCKKGISGSDLISYIRSSTIDELFERQMRNTGSGRSGTLRGGQESIFYKFYTICNLNFLRNRILSRLEINKTYYSDCDLYCLGNGMFLDACEIDPMFAASLSQIREVKYSVVHKDRSQCRDRFTSRDLQKLVTGGVFLQIPNNYSFSIIPEYEIYLENKNNNIDECSMLSYNFNNFNIIEEKKMSFEKGNKVRPKGRLDHIVQLLAKCDMNEFQIIYELRDNYEPDLDPINQKHINNVKKSLRKLCRSRRVKLSKKTDKYSLNNTSTITQPEKLPVADSTSSDFQMQPVADSTSLAVADSTSSDFQMQPEKLVVAENSDFQKITQIVMTVMAMKENNLI